MPFCISTLTLFCFKYTPLLKCSGKNTGVFAGPSSTDSMDKNLGKRQEMVRYRDAWRPAVHGVTKRWT